MRRGVRVWKFVDKPSCRTGSSCSGQAQRKSAVWSGAKEGEPALHFKSIVKTDETMASISREAAALVELEFERAESETTTGRENSTE